jgi:predicted transcriptional regulator
MAEKRILRIGIATRDEMKRRTIAIAKGERRRHPDEPSVWFSSMESLGKVLSARNMLLLDIIRRAEPQSISELASESGRAKSNLSRTLKNLSEIGVVEMVERSERGRKMRAPRVRYDDFELRGPLGAAA